jgi:GntR family transcriptional regulator/MocR family aminotransferase
LSRRDRASLPILIRFEAASRVPYYRQLILQLRDAILGGRISGGALVPSSRGLARELGVARNTVTQAYDQLAAEGFLEGRGGSGTRVALGSPGGHDGAETRWPPRRHRSLREGDAVRALRGFEEPAYRDVAGPPGRAFRLGVPAFERFPFEAWARLAGRRRRRATPSQLAYGDRRGESGLRAAIARHIAASRGVRCHPEQVLVTSGSQMALDLVSRLLIRRDDPVWVEEPGYHGAKGAALAAGARLVPVAVDGHGLVVAEGKRRAPRARVAFVTPSHQFPLGVTMTLDRRIELLEWAARQDAWIVEDDYDSEFRYDAHPLMALQGLDAAGRVLYVGTFSKTLFPSLRLGYLVVPEALVEPLIRLRIYVEPHPPILQQLTLGDFLEEGHYARHIRKARTLYRQRQGTLVRAAAARLDGLLAVAPSGAGMHVTGWLNRGVREAAVVQAAAERGVALLSVGSFRLKRGGAPGLVLGYGGTTPSSIREGVERLRAVLLEF